MTASLSYQLLAFFRLQHPALVGDVENFLSKHDKEATATEFLALQPALVAHLARKITPKLPIEEVLPGCTGDDHFKSVMNELEHSVACFFERQRAVMSISDAERLEILEGMILTRAVDNQLKKLFLSGEMQYRGQPFQGKGFRSSGQEAIYAAALKLKKGAAYWDGQWRGDVVAPLIRDLGVALAFCDNEVLPMLNAQVGKDAPPLFGRDFHLGDLHRGVWPAAAPLSIATCSLLGVALAAQLKKTEQVCFSFIGDGGTSIGEWHEAINFAGACSLPMVFCVENNQTALSTPTQKQSAVKRFSSKALGYGLMGFSADGNDPEAVAAAFSYAADRARGGQGPTLIELITYRMCGHAHHDDMLYLGYEPQASFDLPAASDKGYADRAQHDAWRLRDPIATYAEKLISQGIVSIEQVRHMQATAVKACTKATDALKELDWPNPIGATDVFYRTEALSIAKAEQVPAFSPQGSTYMEAIALAVEEIMRKDPSAIMLGEDVAPPYGNAFMMFNKIPSDLWERFFNTPISEAAIIGALVGLAQSGFRPLGEMQFNDFVACGFNQLVNNAAPFYYRTQTALPFVLRMPYGGLRRAGPYHSQDTSPWFYRVPGLKIVAPSTPHEARALLHAAHDDPNPVLFYEHIALYRDPKIRQTLTDDAVAIGKARVCRAGADMTLVSYGAYVHRALRVAEQMAQEDIDCEVIDLRTLWPLDFDCLEQSLNKTARMLLVGEDHCRGSLLESIAAQVQERLFERLDAPVAVLGALDTPVPYAPSLEDAYLLSDEAMAQKIRELSEW